MRYLASLTLAFALAACAESTDVRQSDTTCLCEMRVSPATANMNVGERLTFVVTGLSRGGVTWTSSDTTVATVDRYGTVQSLRVGVASVIASSTVDPTVQAAAVVTVGAVLPGQSFTGIASINYASTGTPAKLDSLAGAIDVLASIGNSFPVSETRLVLNNGTRDTVVVANTTPIPAGQNTQVHLVWNTSATTAAGTRVFPAGGYTLRVQAFTTSGIASNSATIQVTLRNP